jgi:hypothetical protein
MQTPISIIPSANQPHTARRIAASARGAKPCEFCQYLRCDACGHFDQTHRNYRHIGGRAGTWVVVLCHNETVCEARQERAS